MKLTNKRMIKEGRADVKHSKQLRQDNVPLINMHHRKLPCASGLSNTK